VLAETSADGSDHCLGISYSVGHILHVTSAELVAFLLQSNWPFVFVVDKNAR
jgi:hypothetical protein